MTFKITKELIRLDIRHLEYFMAVAHYLNFTKAANHLHLTQPSLSKTIKQMEDTLGVPLFHRSFRKLELTDAGKALLQNAKVVLKAYQNLTSELNDVASLQKGEIRVGIPPIIGAAFCSMFISEYVSEYPNINMSLIEVGSKKIEEGIDEGTLDIGFICHRPDQNKPIENYQVFHDPLMLVVHESHVLSREEKIQFAMLKDEKFIMYRDDFSLYDRIVRTCLAHQFYPEIVCESSQKDFMMQMVAANLGIALLPKKICDEMNNKELKAIPFTEIPIHLDLRMIWRKGQYIPYAVRAFIEKAEMVTSY